jgi:hypothetical protein
MLDENGDYVEYKETIQERSNSVYDEYGRYISYYEV